MVMKYRLLVFLSVAAYLMVNGSQASAHHAFYSVYDRAKTVKIEGTLKEIICRNPHSFVNVDAPRENAEVQRWMIDLAVSLQLTEKVLSSSTLRPRDKI